MCMDMGEMQICIRIYICVILREYVRMSLRYCVLCIIMNVIYYEYIDISLPGKNC